MKAASSAELFAINDINGGLTIYSIRSKKPVRELYPGTKHISCISFSN